MSDISQCEHAGIETARFPATKAAQTPPANTRHRRLGSVSPLALVLASSTLARLPLAMRSITLLVFAQRVTHSFSIARLVTGVYAAGNATGGPVLGRLVDRYGQTLVLLIAASASSVLMVTMALAPADIPSRSPSRRTS
jgi:MFS family permease